MIFSKKALFSALAIISSGSTLAEDWDVTLEQLQSQFIVPKYSEFSQSAELLASKTQTLCQSPNEQTLTEAKQAFIDNVEDWQQVQWLNFGPVTYFMRYYAYEYWPDAKGVTQRQLRGLSAEPEMMQASKFWTSASIAVRGMTAIESLLYHGDFNVLTRPSDCEVLQAVSQHHAKTSEDVLKQWQQSKATDWVFLEEGSTTSPQHLALEQMIQQWLEHMSVVKDTKFEVPIGYNGKANLKLAEFYRSEQSLDAIQSNLKSYRTLYHVGSPSLFDTTKTQQPELAEKLEDALANNLKIAMQLPSDFFTGDYTQEERVKMAKPLVSSISNSQQTLTNLVTSMGFQIGFNSRDGD